MVVVMKKSFDFYIPFRGVYKKRVLFAVGDAALGGDVVQRDLRLLQGVWPDIHQGRQVPQRGRVHQLRI